MLRVLRFVLRFRLCMVGHVYVAHARAVRFMHAFCFDMVVLVFCSSVSCSVCPARVAVSFLRFAHCFCFLLVIIQFGASVFEWFLFAFVVPLFLLAVLGGSDCRRSLVCCGFMLCMVYELCFVIHIEMLRALL